MRYVRSLPGVRRSTGFRPQRRRCSPVRRRKLAPTKRKVARLRGEEGPEGAPAIRTESDHARASLFRGEEEGQTGFLLSCAIHGSNSLPSVGNQELAKQRLTKPIVDPDTDMQTVISIWDKLPSTLKAAVIAIASSSRGN
jgi:hypothetical protein